MPKAATLFLTRQYALDYGRDGIRTGAVNADRIRSWIADYCMIAERSQARGLTERDFTWPATCWALKLRLRDVAQAFLNQALALKTTADVTTVDGNIVALR